MMREEIKKLIPQREPFLFVDKIISKENNKIQTSLKLTGDEDFFKGHFPGNPIMPGVLLQEAIFQTGALLMSGDENGGLGVVTRVQNAKFKNMVKPMDELIMEVELVEKISNASYMKGKSSVNGKIVLSIEFAVASI
jgi:3-hydroxyacyl-[acyl-carrier-protein] dehydratase